MSDLDDLTPDQLTARLALDATQRANDLTERTRRRNRIAAVVAVTLATLGAVGALLTC